MRENGCMRIRGNGPSLARPPCRGEAGIAQECNSPSPSPPPLHAGVRQAWSRRRATPWQTSTSSASARWGAEGGILHIHASPSPASPTRAACHRMPNRISVDEGEHAVLPCPAYHVVQRHCTSALSRRQVALCQCTALSRIHYCTAPLYFIVPHIMVYCTAPLYCLVPQTMFRAASLLLEDLSTHSRLLSSPERAQVSDPRVRGQWVVTCSAWVIDRGGGG